MIDICMKSMKDEGGDDIEMQAEIDVILLQRAFVASQLGKNEQALTWHRKSLLSK